MQSGQYSRHLTRMRKLYRDRQAALKAALAVNFRIPHEILGGAAGLHLTVCLLNIPIIILHKQPKPMVWRSVRFRRLLVMAVSHKMVSCWVTVIRRLISMRGCYSV